MFADFVRKLSGLIDFLICSWLCCVPVGTFVSLQEWEAHMIQLSYNIMVLQVTEQPSSSVFFQLADIMAACL